MDDKGKDSAVKIKNKMIIAVTLVVVLLSGITSSMWYYNSVRTINKYLEDYSSSVMDNAYYSIRAVTDNVSYTLTVIGTNYNNLISPLKNNLLYGDDKSYAYEELMNDRKIEEFISSVYGYKDYLSGIIVFPVNYADKYYKTGAIPKEPGDIFKALQDIPRDRMGRSSVLLEPRLVDKNYSSRVGKLVPMVNTIESTDGQIYGYIVALFEYSALDKIVENSLPEDSKLQLLDDNGTLIYTNCGDEELKYPKQNLYHLLTEKSVYNEIVFGTTKWVCKMQVTADRLIGNVNRTLFNILLVYVIILVLGIGMAVFICHRLTRNIIILNNAMQQVAIGNLDTKVAIATSDETGEMGQVFNDMVNQISGLIEEVKDSEKNKRKAEIDFLQAQINPHFVSNVLNTIVFLADVQNAGNITRLTKALIELLHNAMKAGGELITVANEITYIDSYLEIEQYTCADNFEVCYQIPEEVKDLYVPRFLLQPIVENAVLHSLSKLKDRFGELRIAISEETGRLKITIYDNGTGMTPEEIEYAIHHVKKKTKGQFNSIGIANVTERIRLMFGDDYGISYRSSPGEYTEVTITLPVIRERDGYGKG